MPLNFVVFARKTITYLEVVVMYMLLNRKSVILGALLALSSTAVQAAKVGYYEMCYSEGRSWAITTISAAGHTPVYLADLTSADLNGLDVLFVTNCYNLGYGAEYLSRLPAIDAAVQNGLVMMMHDRTVANISRALPGGSGIGSVYEPAKNINVYDNTTLVTNGPGGVVDNETLDNARNSEHGYVHKHTLPANTRVILTRPAATQAVTLSYPHGKGHVIYSTIPLDYYAGILPVCRRYSSTDPVLNKCLYIANIYGPNVIAYAAELTNSQPTANAGIDQSVDEGSTVVLDGSASVDSSGGVLTYKWTQIAPASPVIDLQNAASAKPSFVAPYISSNLAFTFQLVAVNASGAGSEPDTVDITVKNTNNPPVADAGDAFSIKAGAIARLNGGHSYDPDNDVPLTYQWTQVAGPAVELLNAQTVTPEFVVPDLIGQSIALELVVSDGREASPPATILIGIVENAAPLANAGVDLTKDEGSIVALNAMASTDVDGDGLFFEWTQVSGPTVSMDNPGSPTPFFTAPKVTPNSNTLLEFEVLVSDMDTLYPKSSSDRILVHIRNINDPPACALAQPSLAQLWPPNHKMRQVRINGVSDNDNIYNNVAIAITSISQDEPVVGHGSGHTSPDAVIQSTSPSDIALLRAERAGHGDGRVYQINFTASDGFESCTGNVQVTVPRSRKPVKYLDCDGDKKSHKDKHHKGKGRHEGKRHKRCQVKKSLSTVDNGQLYDATEQLVRRRHAGERLKEKLGHLQDRGKKHAHKDRDHKNDKSHKEGKHAKEHKDDHDNGDNKDKHAKDKKHKDHDD